MSPLESAFFNILMNSEQIIQQIEYFVVYIKLFLMKSMEIYVIT